MIYDGLKLRSSPLKNAANKPWGVWSRRIPGVREIVLNVEF